MRHYKQGDTVPISLPSDLSSSAPKIRFVRESDGYILDLTGNVFRSSGWTTKQGTATARDGHWAYNLDSTAIGAGAFSVQPIWTADGEDYLDSIISFNMMASVSAQDLINGGVATSTNVSNAKDAIMGAIPPAPNNTGINTLLTRLSQTRANNLDFLDVLLSSRLAAADYSGGTDDRPDQIINLLQNATFGLSALKFALTGIPTAVAQGVAGDIGNAVSTAMGPVVDGLDTLAGAVTSVDNRMASLNNPSEGDIATAVAQSLQSTLETIALATAYIEALTELTDTEERRFTPLALSQSHRLITEIEVIRTQGADLETQIMYQHRKTFTAPPPEDGITKVQVYHSTDPLSEVWSLAYEEDYVQGTNEVTFTSLYSGYFKLAFMDGDGNLGPMSETFAVVNGTYDLDLTFALESNSTKWVAGEKRYLTIEATDPEGKVNTIPGEATITVIGPTGTAVVTAGIALIDGMSLKYLLDTTGFAAGLYFANVIVNTGHETIQNQKPLKLKVSER